MGTPASAPPCLSSDLTFLNRVGVCASWRAYVYIAPFFFSHAAHVQILFCIERERERECVPPLETPLERVCARSRTLTPSRSLFLLRRKGFDDVICFWRVFHTVHHILDSYIYPQQEERKQVFLSDSEEEVKFLSTPTSPSPKPKSPSPVTAATIATATMIIVVPRFPCFLLHVPLCNFRNPRRTTVRPQRCQMRFQYRTIGNDIPFFHIPSSRTKLSPVYRLDLFLHFAQCQLHTILC